MTFLTISALEKTWPDGTRAVRGVDLSVDEGEFIVLLGPSGCGKTTTLRMTAGLETPTGGRISLAGRDVTSLRPRERDVGMVFQFYALYPHLTVRDNVAFPLACAGVPRGEARARAAEIAGRMGFTDLLSSFPSRLAGGDQQKVALARAMVRKPKLFLMDEPLGTLDAGQRLGMREMIRAQQLETKVTTLYVTHDQEEAMSLADRVVVMDEGSIAQAGPPGGVYARPANLFVARFVGSPGMNLVRGTLGGSPDAVFVTETGGVRIPLGRAGAGASADGSATLGIRPEHVLVDPSGTIEGRVAVDEYLGSARIVHVETPFGRILARAGAGAARRPGDTLRVRFQTEHARIFDGKTGRAL